MAKKFARVFDKASLNRRTQDMRPSYRWTIDIEVSETWVEDGFGSLGSEATPAEEARRRGLFELMLAERILSCAYGSEISVKIVKEPCMKAVRRAQGYDTKKGS